MSWIKVRTELPNSVKILKLQRILGCSRMEAVGLAVSWFAWVDAHCDSEVTHLALPDFQEVLCPANASSVTTNASSVTTNASSVTTNAGSVTRDSIFMAFQSIGWIALDENGEVLIIDFEKHNGENAKRRAQNAKRVAKHKTNAGSVTTNAGSVTTNAGSVTTNAGSVTTNAGSVTKIEENVKPLTQVALPLTHDALPLTQVALPREDKIREEKNNNNLSISLKETSNQSNYANNNTTASVDVKSETAENALKTAFSTPDDKMFGTREETPNKPISVANKANSAQPCRIIEVFSYLETYFPAFTSEEHEQIANEFFVENSRSNWQNVTNWKLSLQRLIQSKYVRA